MKPFHLLTAAATLSVITACSMQHSSDPFAPTPAMAKSAGKPLADLGKGHAIFMRQCSQCHDKRIPNEIPTGEWHKIVPGMAWNAGLSEEERTFVTDYVTAASKVKTTTPASE